jgi:hypothetical protein
MMRRLSSSLLEASLEGAACEIVLFPTLPFSAWGLFGTITGFQFGRRCMEYQIDLPQQSKEGPSVPILGQQTWAALQKLSRRAEYNRPTALPCKVRMGGNIRWRHTYYYWLFHNGISIIVLLMNGR